MIHDLKTWHEPFQAVWDNRKRFEFRKNDRNFQIGDTLRLREWEPGIEYSGRVLYADVKYMTENTAFGIPEGYCVMSLSDYVHSVDGRAAYQSEL